MNHSDIKSEFWALYQVSKRKTNSGQRARAQEELLDFAKEHILPLAEAEIAQIFGKFAEFATKWANGRLVTNRFGKKLYVSIAN